MQKLSLVINTVTKNKDVWPMFFSQIEKHVSADLFHKKYIFVDKCDEEFPEGYEVVFYDKEKMYQEQFAGCIAKVPEAYCVYISEDYILYKDAREDLIEKYVNVLGDNEDISFIRFMKGGIVDMNFLQYQNFENLYELYNFFPYFYTNQAAVWKTRDLEKIHVYGPNLHIGNADHENSFEYQATKTCEQLGIGGLFCYHKEPKRGLYHYDCDVFPHISTALVKGKWNLSEYEEELTPLLDVHGIDVNIRGVF